MAHFPGKFVWTEHNSPKASAAQQFYGEVLGWKVKGFPMGAETYEMITLGDGTGDHDMVGGYNKSDKAEWLSYMSVDNVDDAAKRVTTAGGKVLQPAADIPTVGRFAKVADPQGAVFYLFRSLQQDPADIQKLPVGSAIWTELWTPDDKKSLDFYEKVFGYTHESKDMGGGTIYHILQHDGVMRAGVMKNAEAPTMWCPYFSVADCDAAVERAKKLGGKVHMGPHDIPNIGRFAILADPQGATFAMMKPAM